MTDATATELRRRFGMIGGGEGVTLVIVAVMPILAVVALIAVLPVMFEHFSAVPNYRFLVPMIVTVPSLCVAVFSTPAGMIADRWGRRRLLLAALAAFSALGLLPLLFDNLMAIIASRVIVGLAEASILVCCNALWGDYFAEDERRKWLGYQQITGQIASALLAFAGGALASWHWNYPFWLYSLGIPPLILAALFVREPVRVRVAQSATTATATAFPWRVAGLIAAATLGVSLVFFMITLQMGRMFAALGVSSSTANGAFIMVAASGGILGAFVFNAIRRSSVGRLLALGLAAYGIGYIGISLAPNVATGVGFSFIAQVGSSIVLPALIAWTLRSFPVEHRARGIGIWGATFYAGQFFSAPLLTVLELWRGSLLAATGLVGVCTLSAAAVTWWASRSPAPRTLTPPSGI